MTTYRVTFREHKSVVIEADQWVNSRFGVRFIKNQAQVGWFNRDDILHVMEEQQQVAPLTVLPSGGY